MNVYDTLTVNMSEQPTTPQINYRTYSFPELGVSVQARTIEEATTKAKKEAKESDK